MQANLSFEQAPPISVPLRFLLTAPWFGVAAGLVLAWSGDDALASRWSAPLLAATHLLTAGFMLQAMCGALLQFVPVVAGGNVWRPGLLATLVHPALVLAAAFLAVAFLGGGVGLRPAAGIFLIAIGLYCAVVAVALARTPAQGAAVRLFRAALFCLPIVVAGGAVSSEIMNGSFAWPLAATVDLHAAWGLAGWSLLLLAGAAINVVPMFQMTPPYPSWLGRGLPVIVLVTLLLWTTLWLAGVAAMESAFAALLAVATLLFAATTLRLQQRRRRRHADATFVFFRGAMLSLLAAAVLLLSCAAVPALAETQAAPIWLGTLLLVGGFMSAINGMAYKIVPFLAWLHLQQSGALTPPNMNEMIGSVAMRAQMRLHFTALGLLLAAARWPALAAIAGLTLAISCAWLGINLIAAVRGYVHAKRRIAAVSSSRGS